MENPAASRLRVASGGLRRAALIKAELEALSCLTAAMNEARAAQAELVAVARTNGASWAAIGEALGISKQLAHQRFSQRVGGGNGAVPSGS